MKSVDIRKIYVCEIQKINNLYQEKTDEDDIVHIPLFHIQASHYVLAISQLDELDNMTTITLLPPYILHIYIFVLCFYLFHY